MTKTVYLFPNGNASVCENGVQVPELQRKGWFQTYLEWLELHGVDPRQCEFNAPGGHKFKVYKRAEEFRNDGGGRWTWEIVE